MGWSNQQITIVVCVVSVFAFCHGGPTNLKVSNVTGNSMMLSWTGITPSIDFNISSYSISAIPQRTHFTSPETYEGSTAPQQTSTVMLGLSPATRYNISVWAVSDNANVSQKASLESWTLLGDPPQMPRPQVEGEKRNDKYVFKVMVNPPSVFHDLVSKYQIIVMEQNPLMAFDPANLKSFEEAEEQGITFYLAGEIDPQSLSAGFLVGDGGSKTNPELKSNNYDVLVGAIFNLNGETKSAYSLPLSGRSVLAESGNESEGPQAQSMRRRDAVLVFMLSVAIGILGFLLVASFILYFILRRQYSQKRRSDELILKIHDHNNDNPYFANGQLHLEEGADMNGFYNKLCDLYWQIPRPQLHITETMLGQGTYGPVRIGKVLRNGKEIPAQVQRCGAHFALSDRDRRVLLSDLEAMVRIGSHENVVEFIGGCEEGDALWMATEHPNVPLRGVLLSSRQPQEDGRVCSIPEYRFLEIAISIADGMKHLAHRGITHGYISTRSVMIVQPEMTPKISNFCIARYTPLGKKLDYTRWTAPEAMRKRVTHKGDVWSFGILLWELLTLGGTPYVDVNSNELLSKISRGHRLSQPRGVEDSLFQMMLSCWEIDPDERPTFERIAKDLRSFASEDPFRLPQQSKYIYDKFNPLADES